MTTLSELAKRLRDWVGDDLPDEMAARCGEAADRLEAIGKAFETFDSNDVQHDINNRRKHYEALRTAITGTPNDQSK